MTIAREVIGERIWAVDAAVPSDKLEPPLSYIKDGWPLGAKPPRQYYNWLNFAMSNNIAFFEQQGFFEWDSSIKYQKFGICRGADDVIYISKTDINAANNPSGGTDLVNWTTLSDFLGANSGQYFKILTITSAEAIAGTITLPDGKYDVYCVGGGGGGSNGQSGTSRDGAGGGGAASSLTRVVGGIHSIAVGVGGVNGTSGGDGGTTSFGPSQATGGYGGGASTASVLGSAGKGGLAINCTGDFSWNGATAQGQDVANPTLTSDVYAGRGGSAGGPYGGKCSGFVPVVGGESDHGAGGTGGETGSNIGRVGADGVIFIIGV